MKTKNLPAVCKSFQMGVTVYWPDWFLDAVSEDLILLPGAKCNTVVMAARVVTGSGTVLASHLDCVKELPDGTLFVSKYQPISKFASMVENAKSADSI
jgi:hypothetical protein